MLILANMRLGGCIMNVKKQLVSLAVLGTITVSAATSAFAAGIGSVDFDTLVTSHKNYQKAVVQMQSAVKQANTEFTNQSTTLKTDDQRRALAQQLNQRLNALQNQIFGPIQQDIANKVNIVRKEKGLDAIVFKGSVIAADAAPVDETQAVLEKLK